MGILILLLRFEHIKISKKKDIQIFEQMCCAKHFVILTGLFLRTVYLNISFLMAKKTVPYKKWCYIVNTLYIIIYF